jgi:hypothetical protein
MKIAIGTEGDAGFSKHEFPPTEPVVVEVRLPKEVKRSLGLVRRIIKTLNGNPPVANYTAQGHGDEYGLIFKISEGDSFDFLPGHCSTDFFRKRLTARISYGLTGTDAVVDKNDITYNDPAKMNRLHLNVFARKAFPPEEGIDCHDRGRFKYASETIHFSMRWLKGEFDDVWNDGSIWLACKKSGAYRAPSFDETRTTYMTSEDETDHVNGEIRGGGITLDRIAHLLGPGRPRSFKNWGADELTGFFPAGTSLNDAREIVRGIRPDSFPVIGYSPVLGFLSKFGNVSQTDVAKIPSMSMGEGVEYIFGKVLPAMKAFVES